MAETALAALKTRIGRPLFSDWLLIDQAMIDTFAQATGDHQFIHVNPELAAQTPFGGTIAHGFLLLSLLSRLEAEASAADLQTHGLMIRMGVNYGGNKVRFLSPVRSGTRVRGKFTMDQVAEKRPGQIQLVTEYVLEVEGSDKPALIAEWIAQIFV